MGAHSTFSERLAKATEDAEGLPRKIWAGSKYLSKEAALFLWTQLKKAPSTLANGFKSAASIASDYLRHPSKIFTQLWNNRRLVLSKSTHYLATACNLLSAVCGLLSYIPVLQVVALPLKAGFKIIGNNLKMISAIFDPARKRAATREKKYQSTSEVRGQRAKNAFEVAEGVLGVAAAIALIVSIAVPVAAPVTLPIAFGLLALSNLSRTAADVSKLISTIKKKRKPHAQGAVRRLDITGDSLNIVASVGSSVSALLFAASAIAAVAFPPAAPAFLVAGIVTGGVAAGASLLGAGIRFISGRIKSKRKKAMEESEMEITSATEQSDDLSDNLDHKQGQGKRWAPAQNPYKEQGKGWTPAQNPHKGSSQMEFPDPLISSESSKPPAKKKGWKAAKPSSDPSSIGKAHHNRLQEIQNHYGESRSENPKSRSSSLIHTFNYNDQQKEKDQLEKVEEKQKSKRSSTKGSRPSSKNSGGKSSSSKLKKD